MAFEDKDVSVVHLEVTALVTDARAIFDAIPEGKPEREPTVGEQITALREQIAEYAADPRHDPTLHEGPDKAADIDQSFCPQCRSIVLLQRAIRKLEESA